MSQSSSPERRNSDESSDSSWQQHARSLPAVYTRFAGMASDEEKALLGREQAQASKALRMGLSRSSSFAHQVVRKRQRYVTLLFLVGFISSLTLLASTKHADGARRVFTAQVDRLKKSSSRRSTEACDPFRNSGTLVTEVGSDGLPRTYWKAFDEVTCPTSRLSTDLRAAMHAGLPSPQLHQMFPWMVNRTVVKVGDSIDRFHVIDFCQLIGGELTVLTKDSKDAVPDHTNGRDELAFTHPESATSELARPHVCRIEALNFELINFFTFGLASFREFQEEGFLAQMPHAHAPAEFGDRVKHTVLATLEHRGRHADVLEFNSLLWDVRHQIEQDRRLIHEAAAQEPSSLSQLAWYRVRLSMALGHLQYTFNDAQILWRRPHPVQCNDKRATCTRAVQLGQVADALLSDRPDIRVDTYGSLLEGQTPYFKDALHPGPRYASVWSDIILFELKRAVKLTQKSQ